MMMPTSPTSSPDRRQQRLSGTFAAVLGSERRRSGSFSPSLQQKRRSVSGSSSRTQSPAPPLCFEDDDSDAAAAAAALPSELSERYDLGNLIGRGAYSAVWRAVERSTDRRVAIKVFKFYLFFIFNNFSHFYFCAETFLNRQSAV